MEHLELQRSLADFAAARLEPEAATAVRSHLERCRDCREAVAAYSCLAELFAGAGSWPAAGLHPPADRLASEAVQESSPDAPDRQALAEHLEDCAECRRHLALTRRALAGARGRHPSAAARPARRPRLRLALAAGIALALLVAGSWAFIPRGQRPAAGEQEIAGRLDGTRIIESSSALVARGVEIAPGAHITLRGGGVVALTDGFSVASEATLVVEVLKAH